MSNSQPPVVTLRKNIYGHFEHEETHLLFNKQTKHVYARQNNDGSISMLTPEDIEICKTYKFAYSTAPLDDKKLNSNISSAFDTRGVMVVSAPILPCITSFTEEAKEESSDSEYSEEDQNNVSEEITRSHTEEKLSTTEEKLLTAETNYKSFLIDLLVDKWEKKFNIEMNKVQLETNDTPKICVFNLYNCRIKNIYGLEFYGFEFSYCYTTCNFHIEFDTFPITDGIIDHTNENLEVYSIGCRGKSIRESFSGVLEKMNTHVFCKHCGHIKLDSNYYIDQEKCESCLITDILMCDSKVSEYCSICMESTKNFYTLRCGHKFHRSCISGLQHKICPLCRKHINEEDEGNDESNYLS